MQVGDASPFGNELREVLNGSGFAVKEVLAEVVGSGFVAGVIAAPAS